MITILKSNEQVLKNGKGNAIEFRGLSTDTKPTTLNDEDINNGSTFIEIDTGKIYFYDLDSKEWMEI